jgi:hypothetical protein
MHVSSPNLITSFAIFGRIDSHLNDSEDYEKLTCYGAKRAGAKMPEGPRHGCLRIATKTTADHLGRAVVNL